MSDRKVQGDVVWTTGYTTVMLKWVVKKVCDHPILKTTYVLEELPLGDSPLPSTPVTHVSGEDSMFPSEKDALLAAIRNVDEQEAHMTKSYRLSMDANITRMHPIYGTPLTVEQVEHARKLLVELNENLNYQKNLRNKLRDKVVALNWG